MQTIKDGTKDKEKGKRMANGDRETKFKKWSETDRWTDREITNTTVFFSVSLSSLPVSKDKERAVTGCTYEKKSTACKQNKGRASREIFPLLTQEHPSN